MMSIPATGKDEDIIHDVESITWGSDRYLFYTRVNSEHRPNQVFRHELDTDPASDELVFEEQDSRFFCSVWTSLSGRYVFISTDMNDQSEVWYIPCNSITSMPLLIEPRTEDLEYSVEHQGDRFLILTNADGACLSLEPLLEFDEKAFRFGYESPSTHDQTWRFDMETGERSLLKQEIIPSGHDPKHYVVRRLYAESPDGQQVPLTLLHHQDTLLDGSAPCWLTGYGAIADVPFVDVLHTLLDESLPLTLGEWSQWGNPKEDSRAFDNIRSYCPYTNVQARPYPPMLVTAGISDSRVTYWEPAKWVARHRQRRADTVPLYLKTNLSSGHFGETGRYASLAEYALEQAFALKMMGLLTDDTVEKNHDR